jgi:diguanylate cyclase (GGDEF)-like protein
MPDQEPYTTDMNWTGVDRRTYVDRRSTGGPPQHGHAAQADRHAPNGIVCGDASVEPAAAALLKLVPHTPFDEEEFADRSAAIAAHHRELTLRLERPVGLAVAALDYLVNISNDLVSPTIIERDVLDVLERRSVTDSLTGLFNRLHFDATLRREVARSVRYKSRLSLLLMDLDEFKSVNDRGGHPAGDFLLVEVARAIQKNVRSSDIASRYGGDEFAIILPDTDSKSALSVAERICASVASTHRSRVADDGRPRVTVSGGLAELAFGDLDASESGLIAAADEALYRAKGRGGNCVAEVQFA